MPASDVSWASYKGLKDAAIRIDAEARRFERVVSDLLVKVNATIVNPETFGTDKGGREFFAKWQQDVRNWDEGVRSLITSIVAVATGVDNMANAVNKTDKITTSMADDLVKGMNGGAASGPRGAGGGAYAPNIPPLTPSPTGGGTSGGSGNSGSVRVNR